MSARVSLYGRLVARLYDRCLTRVEAGGLTAMRRELVAQASGRVLEIGAGTGLNLALYPPSTRELLLTEPDHAMADRLETRRRSHERATEVLRSPAEALPLDDASVDVVVSTLVLCSVDDVGQALAEVRRVLRPAGRLLLIEHVRAEDPRLARWQDRLNPLQRLLARGCNLNRPTAALLERSGFAIDGLVSDRLPRTPAVVRPLIRGAASLRRAEADAEPA